MGRYSRNRQLQQKKNAKNTEEREPRSSTADEQPSGSLMSMRSGFRNMAGTENSPGKKSVWSIVGYVLLVLVLIAFVWSFVGR
ncbi:MAG: hypothetical protein RBU37_03485 [Myxococcota bacterium]|jgi:hypothetical protein|nr:hypothetical protein [Myxococcota bacterium]